MPTSTVTDKALASELVRSVIEEQVLNLTQGFAQRGRSPHKRRDTRHLENELIAFARQVAGATLKTSHGGPDFGIANWRRAWANESVDAAWRSGAEALIDETLEILRSRFPRQVCVDPQYISISLHKITTYVAQVSRMIHLGLDPVILTFEYQEATRLAA